MSKLQNILKKTLKTILWIVLVFVILFIIVAGLIQIPSIQTKIVTAATSFVSKKTNNQYNKAYNNNDCKWNHEKK